MRASGFSRTVRQNAEALEIDEVERGEESCRRRQGSVKQHSGRYRIAIGEGTDLRCTMEGVYRFLSSIKP